jgi:hypothetical protein
MKSIFPCIYNLIIYVVSNYGLTSSNDFTTVSNELKSTWKDIVVGSIIGSPVFNSKANNTNWISLQVLQKNEKAAVKKKPHWNSVQLMKLSTYY